MADLTMEERMQRVHEAQVVTQARQAKTAERDVARKGRKQALMEIGFAESVIGGKSIYGVLIKWFFIISIILVVVIGPGLGVILQMGAYLDKQIIFWILGIGALILWLRRR